MRYVIRNPKGLYYSDNQLLGVVPVPRKGDPQQNDMHQTFAPIFGVAFVQQALKYSTEADVRAIMAHPDLVPGKDSFVDAVVCKCEFSDDPEAVEEVPSV